LSNIGTTVTKSPFEIVPRFVFVVFQRVFIFV